MKTLKVKNQSVRRQEMYAIIASYLQAPGGNQREFCERHQIALSTFYYYLAKYRHEKINTVNPKPTGRFIPLSLPDQSASCGDAYACEIMWPGGVLIRFCALPSSEYLMSLLKAGDNGQ